jgi:hypothetical protein
MQKRIYIYIYILVKKPERKSPRGRPRSKWEENIRRDIRDIGLE